MATHVCILRLSDDSVLLRAAADQVQVIGGNYYFHPDALDHEMFEISDRIYTCPQKGVCNWVDLNTDKGYINNVSWVYTRAKSDYKHIAGWFGFYPEHKYYYYSECD